MSKRYVSDHLKIAADKLGERAFLICRGRTLSWADAYRESQFAASFVSERLGSRQQKIIGVLLPDNWQFVVSYFGIVGSGNIAMPLDITFKKLEIDHLLKSIKPEFVVVNRETEHMVDGPKVLVEDMMTKKSTFSVPGYSLPPDRQIATLLFSSGTTGKPKLIPNTHTNQVWDIEALSGPMGWTDQDSILITLHLAHRYGLVICLFGAIYHGNTVYLEERFDPNKTLSLLKSGKVSMYLTVPAAYAKLIEAAPKRKVDVSGVRLFASSSSALPPALKAEFMARFGHTILDRYGTSETGSIAIKRHDSDHAFDRLLDGVEVRLEKGGEVAMRSPGLFPGYFNNPEATKTNRTDDGWWLTGDIGELRNGKLILKGRTKEKINRGGYSVFPQDIEWGLIQNLAVKEVKVVGLANKSDIYNPEDRIVGLYVGQLDPKALEEYARVNLPRSWRPDTLVKLNRIPKTPTGKPKLTELKKLAKQAVDGTSY